MEIQKGKYKIERHDLSNDKSLRPWSAADEYLLQSFSQIEHPPSNLCIYNDRFGFLACYLHSIEPRIILSQKSQEKAIRSNLKANRLPLLNFSDPLAALDRKMDFAILKVPKSLALFQLFLEQIVHNSSKNVTVICAFMTRHFSPKLVEIAAQYFEVTEQSKALKKARLLTLTKKRKTAKKILTTTLNYNDQDYQQYGGVFSGEHIDYATQYLLEHVQIKDTDKLVLDLASGNGVIGNEIYKQVPDAEIHLMDDAFLAVASAKLNVQGENIHHHFNNDFSIFKPDYFDLIVTNPPFHFEYEINIQIPIALFKQCRRCLKETGSFQLVANRHLNYRVHLEPLFSTVEVLAENDKFIVYSCSK